MPTAVVELKHTHARVRTCVLLRARVCAQTQHLVFPDSNDV